MLVALADSRYQVSSVSLLNMNQEVPFSKDVKSVADKYVIS